MEFKREYVIQLQVAIESHDILLSNKSSLDKQYISPRGVLAIIRSLTDNYASSVKIEWLITTTKITFLYT